MVSMALAGGSNSPGSTEAGVRTDLAALHRLAARFGYDDLVWNHITARIPDSESSYLVGRFGLLFREVTASNLLVVDEDGRVLEGEGAVNPTALVIHTAVHKARSDAQFVFHSHAPAALAFCALACELEFLQQDAGMLYGRVGYHDWEGLSLDDEESSRLALSLGSNRALIMRNHGFLTVGSTAGEAFVTMYYLVRAASIQMQAASTGLPIGYKDVPLWEKVQTQYEQSTPGCWEWPALLRLLDELEPDYKG